MRRVYSASLSESVLELIREGKTLAAACRELDLPKGTVTHWISANVDGFAGRYHFARRGQAASWADEIVEIADEVPLSTDLMLRKAALRIKTRQWLIEKLHPETFNSLQKDEDELTEGVTSPMEFLKNWRAKSPVTETPN